MLGHSDTGERVHRAPFLVHGKVAERTPHERHPAEQTEADIGENREPGHQVELLEDDASSDPQVLGAAYDPATALNWPTEYEDRADAVPSIAAGCFLYRDQPRHRTNERRFAGARRPDQRHHFAGANREAHIVQHAGAALERFRDPPHVDKGLRWQAIISRNSDLSAGYDNGMKGEGAPAEFPPV